MAFPTLSEFMLCGWRLRGSVSRSREQSPILNTISPKMERRILGLIRMVCVSGIFSVVMIEHYKSYACDPQNGTPDSEPVVSSYTTVKIPFDILYIFCHLFICHVLMTHHNSEAPRRCMTTVKHPPTFQAGLDSSNSLSKFSHMKFGSES